MFFCRQLSKAGLSGYAHHYYVERAYDAGAFTRAASDFAELLPTFKRNGVDLAGAGGVGEPAIGPHLVEFNGAGGAACESFRLEHEASDLYRRLVGRMPRFHDPNTRECEMNPRVSVGKYHIYTKTEHCPYDLAVVVCLIIAKHYLVEGIVVCSDGAEEKWELARRLCEDRVGYGCGFRLDKV